MIIPYFLSSVIFREGKEKNKKTEERTYKEGGKGTIFSCIMIEQSNQRLTGGWCLPKGKWRKGEGVGRLQDFIRGGKE